MLCPAFTFAATRLFPAKPLGSYGDGGTIFFHDPADLEPLQSFCVNGEGTDRYDNVRIGMNGRMDTLQAAILLHKLDLFDDEITLRGAVADRYAAGLRDVVAVPGTPAGSVSTWAQYTIRVHAARRAAVADVSRARRPERHPLSPAVAQAGRIEGFPVRRQRLAGVRTPGGRGTEPAHASLSRTRRPGSRDPSRPRRAGRLSSRRRNHMSHAAEFFVEAARICAEIDRAAVEHLADGLAAMREAGGRLFVLGVGGSAGNAGHAVNDFRKLCGIEAYAPTDNVCELTARTNDEGWETVFEEYLRVSRATAKDAILIFSVGGGDKDKNVSVNLVRAIDEAKSRGMKVFGIVGRPTGHAAKNGDAIVVVPIVNAERVTPHSEAFQAVVWHCLVSHPKLQRKATKW